MIEQSLAGFPVSRQQQRLFDLEGLQGARMTLAQPGHRRATLVVFYLGFGCLHCVEQLHAIEERIAEFGQRDTVVLAISSDQPERNADNDVGSLPFQVLSDSLDHANAIRFKSYDEFEDL